jgi:hypothetical protein
MEHLLSRRQKALLIFCLLASVVLTADAFARPPYFAEWQSIYPNSTSDDTAGRGGCQVCHGEVSGQWNAYGNSVAALVRSGTAIGDAIAQVASLDADGQGDLNNAEIIANSQPGWTLGSANPIYDNNNEQSGTVDPASIGVLPPLDPPIMAVVNIPRSTLHPHHDSYEVTPFLNDAIPVVVFGASTLVGDAENLDTDQIDSTTLSFGPGMAGQSPDHQPLYNRDEDSDGLDDARFRFLMSDAAFDKVTCDDDTGILTGQLTNGAVFAGSASFVSNCSATCH